MVNISALLLAAAVAGSPAAVANTGNLNVLEQQPGVNNKVIVKQIEAGSSDLQKELGKLGINIGDISNCPDFNMNAITNCPEIKDWLNCPDINLPGNNNPGNNNPGNNNPGNNNPGNNNPGTNNPGDDSTDSSVARQVADLVNAERAKVGLAPLTVDVIVQSAAQVRAIETKTSFSHTRPNGSSFSTALTEAGVQYRGSGENIAYGQKTPEAVMKGWMNSDGHRANILNSKYTSIGVGYYIDESGTPYWAQLFTY